MDGNGHPRLYGFNRGPRDGDVAQLGERLPCTEEVRGSNPLISTTRHDREAALRRLQGNSKVGGSFAKRAGTLKTEQDDFDFAEDIPWRVRAREEGHVS
jgi:hypothetical protein